MAPQNDNTGVEHDIALWKLPRVLAHVPVSRSGWLAGVKAGRYPAPVRLSERSVAWRATDIRALVAAL
jgi:prophage regulatory protein